MARDVYSREVNFGGSFSADSARVTFAEVGAGLLAQNIDFAYQQNVSRLYEIGSSDIYLVAGRTQGNLGMSRVLGPRKLMPEFYVQYGDVCNAGSNHMKFSAMTGCSDKYVTAKESVDMRHIVIVSLRGTINAGNMMLNETLGAMFLYLQFN